MKARVRAVLGSDGVRRLASALRCTPERFNHKHLRSTVEAVIELLELARARCIPQSNLPPRWSNVGLASAMEPAQLKTSFAKLLGEKSLLPRLAHVLEIGQDTIASVFSGRSVRAHADLSAIVELLELLDDPSAGESAWPDRWKRVNDIIERKRATRRLPPRKYPDPQQMKSRVEAIIGGVNPSAHFARALERSPDRLSLIWRSQPNSQRRRAVVQPTLAAVVELLETLRAEGVPIERRALAHR